MNYNAIFLFFFLMTGTGIASASGTDSVNLEMPPSSLEQWYKPVSKRHIWLHTMFGLRREMQAIGEYAEQGGWAEMDKWISRLEKDYRKIAEMVPEWENEIKPRLLPELKMFVEKKDAYRTTKTLKMIQRTCDDCHQNYQPMVTAIYRSPYYGDIKVNDLSGGKQGYEDNMEALSTSVNQILIALDDGHKSKALVARQNLTDQLQNLGGSCSHCHEKDQYPYERILGKATKQRLAALESRISEGRVKESQKLTGEIAVSVCARCHNIHRIVNDLRNALVPDR